MQKTSKYGYLPQILGSYKIENWREVEDFLVLATREVAKNILEESGLCMKDIDLVLVTENNSRVWGLTLEALGVTPEKSISLIKDHGNTMSAMLPLLIDFGLGSGKIQKGMRIMMISHGEGMSGGGLIYRV